MRFSLVTAVLLHAFPLSTFALPHQRRALPGGVDTVTGSSKNVGTLASPSSSASGVLVTGRLEAPPAKAHTNLAPPHQAASLPLVVKPSVTQPIKNVGKPGNPIPTQTWQRLRDRLSWYQQTRTENKLKNLYAQREKHIAAQDEKLNRFKNKQTKLLLGGNFMRGLMPGLRNGEHLAENQAKDIREAGAATEAYKKELRAPLLRWLDKQNEEIVRLGGVPYPTHLEVEPGTAIEA